MAAGLNKCAYTCVDVCIYVRLHVFVSDACMYDCLRVCTHAYMYGCMYVCMHVCMNYRSAKSIRCGLHDSAGNVTCYASPLTKYRCVVFRRACGGRAHCCTHANYRNASWVRYRLHNSDVSQVDLRLPPQPGDDSALN